MPRSEKKKISDMLDIIATDELLQHKFAKMLLSVIEYDLLLRNKLTEIIGRELASNIGSY